MISELTRDQCAQVLYSTEIGRLGCYSEKKMYIVPVTYVFDGEYIYIHSREGQKITMMRKNSAVCFQVDRIDNFVNWRSVIVWGKFEELNSKQRLIAMKLLRDRLGPMRLSTAVGPSKIFGETAKAVYRPARALAFRIKVQDVTGKFERG